MSNAQNGARIKCWAGPDVGGGIVKNITFEHFMESNVDNPLIVDQVSYASFAALSTKKRLNLFKTPSLLMLRYQP